MAVDLRAVIRETSTPRLLNVGGGSRWLLPMFNGWDQDLLDIDDSCGADICCDARTLKDRPVERQYDAIYNSHFLEHVHEHEVPDVLEGFHKHLKPGGFVYTMVPDLRQLFAEIQTKELTDTWYMAGENKVTYADVLYGWNSAIRSGKPYFAHKYGFTPPVLDAALKQFFPIVLIARDGYNLHALAIKVVL
jgi:SAM-dependent methyltransferase